MEVIFLKRFLSDLKKIKDPKTKRKIIALIETLETAKNLDDLSGIKKISGYGFAYRLRMGDYRLGFFYENYKVELVRFLKRSDLYKVFPKN